jgi:SAM-dependent methyltransferase
MQQLAMKLSPPGGHALGLGVGGAAAERELLALNAVTSYEFYDVSPQLVDAARRSVEEAGLGQRVTCQVADMNRIKLPAETYDLITFISSLHHVERLEYVLDECAKALRPGGLFYALEYVGPNRFAFPDDHVRFARRLWSTLDPALRCAQAQLPTPNPLAVAAADPTESIRSEEIISVCQRVFPTVEIVPEDVCLTLILWYGLNHDALYDTPAGHNLVRWILDVDEALVRTHRLPTYHAEILARKPAGNPN